LGHATHYSLKDDCFWLVPECNGDYGDSKDNTG
jgi:hypothetical protein